MLGEDEQIHDFVRHSIAVMSFASTFFDVNKEKCRELCVKLAAERATDVNEHADDIWLDDEPMPRRLDCSARAAATTARVIIWLNAPRLETMCVCLLFSDPEVFGLMSVRRTRYALVCACACALLMQRDGRMHTDVQ